MTKISGVFNLQTGLVNDQLTTQSAQGNNPANKNSPSRGPPAAPVKLRDIYYLK